MTYGKRHINIAGYNIRYCKEEERVQLKSEDFPIITKLWLQLGVEKKEKKSFKSSHFNLKELWRLAGVFYQLPSQNCESSPSLPLHVLAIQVNIRKRCEVREVSLVEEKADFFNDKSTIAAP